MSCINNYLLTLLQQCSEESFGQEAVEHAILMGAIQLTYCLDADLRAILGEPGRPETGRYSEFVESYQRVQQQNEDALLAVYTQSGLLEEILRPARRAA